MSLIRDLLFRVGMDPGSWDQFQTDLGSGKQQFEAFAQAGVDAGASLDSSLTGKLGELGSAIESTGSQMELFGQEASSAIEDVNRQISSVNPATIEATDTALGALASTAAEEVSPAMEDAAGSAHDLGDAILQNKDEIEEAGSALAELGKGTVVAGAAMTEFTEKTVEFGAEALNAFASTQKAEISLTALTGSAQTAGTEIEALKDKATELPVPFEQLAGSAQRMVALGFSIDQTNEALEAAVNASAATGSAFEAVASAIDRLSLSGTASAKSLASLGLSTEDLSQALGKVTGDADLAGKDLTTAFKALDQAERLEVVTTALQKFGDVGKQEAAGLAGQWQILENRWELFADKVGGDLAPLAQQIVGAFTTIIGVLGDAEKDFAALPVPIQDAIIVLGGLATAAGPVTLALGAFLFSIGEISEAVPKMVELWREWTAVEGEHAIAAEADAAAIGTETTAIEASAAAARTAEGALGAAGITGVLAGLASAAGIAAAALTGGAGLAFALEELEKHAQAAYQASAQFHQEVQALSRDFPDATTHVSQYAIQISDTTRLLLNYAQAADGVDLSQGNVLKSTQAVIDAQDKANAKYQAAVAALQQIDSQFQSASNYAQLHARALADVENAYTALTAKVKDATGAHESYTEALKRVNETYASAPTLQQTVADGIAKIEGAQLKADSAYQIALAIYGQMKTDGVASIQELAAAHDQLVAAATKAGVAEDQWAADVRTAIGYVETGIIVNGKYTQALLDQADASDKASTAVKVLKEDWDEESGTLTTTTDTVNVLTGAVNTNASATAQSTGKIIDNTSAYQANNDAISGVIETDGELVTETGTVISAVQTETSAVNQLAQAWDNVSSAATDASQAQQGATSGQGGGDTAAYLSALAQALANSPSTAGFVTGLPSFLGQFGSTGSFVSGFNSPGYGGPGVPVVGVLDAAAVEVQKLGTAAGGSAEVINATVNGPSAPIPQLADASTAAALSLDPVAKTADAAAGSMHPLALQATDASSAISDLATSASSASSALQVAAASVSSGGTASSTALGLTATSVSTTTAAPAVDPGTQLLVDELSKLTEGAFAFQPFASTNQGSYGQPYIPENLGLPNVTAPGTSGISLSNLFSSIVGPGAVALPENLGLPTVSAQGPGAVDFTNIFAGFQDVPQPNFAPLSAAAGGVTIDMRGSSISSLQSAQQLAALFITGLRTQAGLKL